MMNGRFRNLLAVAGCGCMLMVLGSAAPAGDDDERVHLLHSDVLRHDLHAEGDVQILIGNVLFRHKGVLMYCDSARYYDKQNNFDAFGNVRMLQGDSLSLTSDVMYYNGTDELARSRYNVVLLHNGMELYTDSLNYDRLADMGYYFEGGKMIDGDNVITSDWGEYTPSTHTAIYNYNVHLVNPDYTIDTDTMHYDTDTEMSSLYGPSYIKSGASRVYTTHAYYYSKTDQAILLDRSRLSNNARIMVGDSIFYDEREGWGEAFGNIVFNDTLNRNMFTGEYSYYNDSTGYSMATDSAILIDYSQRDTMWVHADTFKVFTHNIRTDSVYRKMHAYHRVRSYRIDLQSVCDSMIYNTLDSTMTMYKDPIVWNDQQQVLGEEIVAFMNDSTIDSIQVIRQALSIERMDSTHYNQVASRLMHMYMDAGELEQTYAEGNVCVVYYPLDDDSLMIGLNYTETSELRMFLENGQLVKLWMPAATGTLYPLPMAPPEKLYLPNFAWFDYIRPLDRFDIFNWRPKRAGTELKTTTLRQPPMQTLDKVKKKPASTFNPKP